MTMSNTMIPTSNDESNKQSPDVIARQITEVCARLYISIDSSHFNQNLAQYQPMFLRFKKFVSMKTCHYYFDDLLNIIFELEKLGSIQAADIMTQIVDQLDHEHYGYLRDEMNRKIIEENSYLFDDHFHDPLNILPVFSDTYKRQTIQSKDNTPSLMFLKKSLSKLVLTNHMQDIQQFASTLITDASIPLYNEFLAFEKSELALENETKQYIIRVINQLIWAYTANDDLIIAEDKCLSIISQMATELIDRSFNEAILKNFISDYTSISKHKIMNIQQLFIAHHSHDIMIQLKSKQTEYRIIGDFIIGIHDTFYSVLKIVNDLKMSSDQPPPLSKTHIDSIYWIEQSIHSLIDDSFNLYLERCMNVSIQLSHDVHAINQLINETNDYPLFIQQIVSTVKKIVTERLPNEEEIKDAIDDLKNATNELLKDEEQLCNEIITILDHMKVEMMRLVNIYELKPVQSQQPKLPTTLSDPNEASKAESIRPQFFSKLNDEQIPIDELIQNMKWLEEAFIGNDILHLKNEMNGYPGFIKFIDQLLQKQYSDAISTTILIFKQRSQVSSYQGTAPQQDPRAEWTLIFSKIMIERIHNHLSFEEFQELMTEHLENLSLAIEKYKDLYV